MVIDKGSTSIDLNTSTDAPLKHTLYTSPPATIPDEPTRPTPSPSSASTSSSSYLSSISSSLKRRRLDDIYDAPPSSVQSDSSSTCESSSTKAPKRRGRPPKTQTTPLSPSQLSHLPESDARYLQMRNKNNEASRRSRINRKDREQLIENEADQLDAIYSRLVDKERRLEERCKMWKDRVMKLATA